jgi:hypothetical protein
VSGTARHEGLSGQLAVGPESDGTESSDARYGKIGGGPDSWSLWAGWLWARPVMNNTFSDLFKILSESKFATVQNILYLA